MEPTSLIDDAELSLPLEFLTDDDFLVEKENKVFKRDWLPHEPSHGFGSTEKPIGDEEELLAGLTMKTVQSTLKDDFSGGFCGSHAFPAGNDAKAWDSTRCGAVGRRNLNYQTRVSSQAAAAWDLYCSAAEELALMNINGYNNHNGRGLLDLPRKHPLDAAKISNDGSGYYSRQSLQYQKLQAIQFQQLKQQQSMMKHRRQLLQQKDKIADSVDLSPSGWSNQTQRRDVFLGNRTGKRGSTGTGVFLPRCVNHATAEVREKPMLATVLVSARVVQPSVRSSPNLNADESWRQGTSNGGFSSQMKMEQPVNEPQLPSDWAY